jgi:hypothetical protein
MLALYSLDRKLFEPQNRPERRTQSLGFRSRTVLATLINFANGITARNGNLEVPVYFLKAKHGYTVRKLEKRN